MGQFNPGGMIRVKQRRQCLYTAPQGLHPQAAGGPADKCSVAVPKNKYDVVVEWTTVVPIGDTLSVRTGGRVDDGWAKAVEVVLHEYQHRTAATDWGRVDFEYAKGEREPFMAFYIRAVKPGARSVDLRRMLDGIVSVANTVAQVGPHVYELARELREPPAVDPSQSQPPPPGELRANAA